MLLKEKEIVAIEGEWEIQRLNQPTTQDYHKKMIYDSQMGKNIFFFLNFMIIYKYSEES